MSNFKVPTRSDVTENNQAIFDTLQNKLGFVPNIYAFIANNETALGDYLTLQGRKSTLSGKEKEVVNLVSSQINGCSYCQSAHTAIGKLNGFTDEQILEIRGGSISFNGKLDALVKFTSSVVNNRGRASEEAKANFFAAGYDAASLVDVVLLVGEISVTNYIHNLTQVPIDFPIAPSLATTTV